MSIDHVIISYKECKKSAYIAGAALASVFTSTTTIVFGAVAPPLAAYVCGMPGEQAANGIGASTVVISPMLLGTLLWSRASTNGILDLTFCRRADQCLGDYPRGVHSFEYADEINEMMEGVKSDSCGIVKAFGIGAAHACKTSFAGTVLGAVAGGILVAGCCVAYIVAPRLTRD
jgi:hypothetical protein